jgi:hypothetical protein
MARSTSAKQKVKTRTGRPRTGITPMIGLRLRAEVRRRVEEWAAANAMTFSEAVRLLLEIGLENAPAKVEAKRKR